MSSSLSLHVCSRTFSFVHTWTWLVVLGQWYQRQQKLYTRSTNCSVQHRCHWIYTSPTHIRGRLMTLEHRTRAYRTGLCWPLTIDWICFMINWWENQHLHEKHFGEGWNLRLTLTQGGRSHRTSLVGVGERGKLSWKTIFSSSHVTLTETISTPRGDSWWVFRTEGWDEV